MHALVGAVLVRTRGRDALMHDAELHPPDVQRIAASIEGFVTRVRGSTGCSQGPIRLIVPCRTGSDGTRMVSRRDRLVSPGRRSADPTICCRHCSAMPVWRYASSVAGRRDVPVGLQLVKHLERMCRRAPAIR
jgi:hypothetical protein